MIIPIIVMIFSGLAKGAQAPIRERTQRKREHAEHARNVRKTRKERHKNTQETPQETRKERHKNTQGKEKTKETNEQSAQKVIPLP